jgi:hypothetical protein
LIYHCNKGENMFVAYESCTFIPDTSSRIANERGDGDLVIDASWLGLPAGAHGEACHGFLAPIHVTVERAPGVVVKFSGGGRVYHGDEFIGWSYWEEDDTYDMTFDCPCVNFKILAK